MSKKGIGYKLTYTGTAPFITVDPCAAAVNLANKIYESFNPPKIEVLYMCGGVVEMTYENEKDQDIFNGVYKEYRSKR